MEEFIGSIAFWSLIGFAAIMVELLFISGFGMLFIGLGAFTVAGINVFYPEMQYLQYLYFALFSCLWFALLWYPLKNFYHKSPSSLVSNFIGDKVELISDLKPGSIGQVKWSGTIMNAELTKDIKKTIKAGEFLEVEGVRGSILVCKYIIES
jgi:membrane protein implicated in regulation of membrane protease activity